MKTRITTSAYMQMLETVGSKPAEAGGLLFGTRKDFIVQQFVYDKDALTSRSTYTFNAPYLNKMIDKMNERGLELLGFLHSHPPNCTELSSADKMYFQSQFKNFDLDKFICPLMFPAVDGTYDFIPYEVNQDGRIEKTTLELVPDNYSIAVEPPLPLAIPRQERQPFTRKFSFGKYYLLLWSTFLTGAVAYIFAMMILYYQYLSNLLNAIL